MLEIKDVLCNISPFNMKNARYCWFTGDIALPLVIKIKAFSGVPTAPFQPAGDNMETPSQLPSSSSSAVDHLDFSFDLDFFLRFSVFGFTRLSCPFCRSNEAEYLLKKEKKFSYILFIWPLNAHLNLSV